MHAGNRGRRGVLSAALLLAVALFGVDRYASYVHRPGAESKRVPIYATRWCPYCEQLRADLVASGASHTEYDVERSLQGMLGFWALHGRGVPVVVIGPSVVYGYRVTQIAPALRALGFSYRPGRYATQRE